MNIDSAAYQLIYRAFDSSTRSLITLSELFMRYQGIKNDSPEYRQYWRQFCLVTSNKLVFKRTSKRVEMLVRRINAVMPETSVVLFRDQEAVSLYINQFWQIIYKAKRRFYLEGRDFYVCTNQDDSIYLVAPAEKLKLFKYGDIVKEFQSIEATKIVTREIKLQPLPLKIVDRPAAHNGDYSF